MKADELQKGATYYYIGGTAPEPVKRKFFSPHPDMKNAYIFTVDEEGKGKSYTLYGPELWLLYRTESEAWDGLADSIEKDYSVFVQQCRQKAAELREVSDESTIAQPQH